MAEIRYEVRARFGDDAEVIETWDMQEGDEDHQYISAFLDGTVGMSDIAEILADETDLDHRNVSEVEVVRVWGSVR